MSYTKLFSSIVTSTIWTEDANTCKAWVTMLAIANKHGEVQASIPGLAQIAGLPLAVTESAIEKFLSPDKYSRTSDDEGRRIEPIDGGWLLLNHAKYRAMASKDEEKTAAAKRQAAFRDRQKRNEKVTESNDLVTVHNGSVTSNRDIAEADTKAEARRVPPNPQGGFELEIQKSEKPDEQRIAVGKLLGRRESTKWSTDELKLLKAIGEIHADDLSLMQAFYDADIPKETDYRRTTVARLLKHWNGEIDKARAFKFSKP